MRKQKDTWGKAVGTHQKDKWMGGMGDLMRGRVRGKYEGGAVRD